MCPIVLRKHSQQINKYNTLGCGKSFRKKQSSAAKIGSPEVQVNPVLNLAPAKMPSNTNTHTHTHTHTHVCCCSVTKLCLTLCDPMDWSMPGFPELHHPPDFAQTHVHWVSDAIQTSHSLFPPYPALNLSQPQDLFYWVGSSNRVAQVLVLQLQQQSFQWIYWCKTK